MKVRRLAGWVLIAALCVGAAWVAQVRAQPQPMLQKGICFAAWDAGAYSRPDADLALERLASTGADWVCVLFPLYQQTITSTSVFTTTHSPTDSDLIHAITQAHELGLSVMLKPGIGLLNDERGWPGRIGTGFNETQWQTWFASYRGLVQHYAALAQANGVEQFCIGAQLAASVGRVGDWRTVIGAVRARFQGGLTYAASSGEERASITWWDGLDYIGADLLPSGTDLNDPSLDALKAVWAPHAAALGELADRWGKPVVVTSVGLRSLDGSNRTPWDWWSQGPVDLQEQEDGYRAIWETFHGKPWLAGMFWWYWSTDPLQGGACDTDYTPHDKPAEDLLRTWYGGAARSLPAPAAADYAHTLDIYTDRLNEGWLNQSWRASLNLEATDHVYSGTRAISVTLGPWGALSFWHSPFDPTPYHWFEFCLRAAPAGSQRLEVFLYDQNGQLLRARPLDECRYGVADTGGSEWQRFRIPLDDLGTTGHFVDGFAIHDVSGQPATQLWLDELRLLAGLTWRSHLPMVLRIP